MGWFSKKKGRPDAEDAAIRAVVLRQLVSYVFTMPTPQAVSEASLWWTDAEKRQMEKDSRKDRDSHWAALGRFQKYLSPQEKLFSRATMDTVTDRQLIDASWRSEALVTILWALGVAEYIPPYDVQAQPGMISSFLNAEAEEFVREARLRPFVEIDKARDIAESWHWRSRTRQLIEDGTAFPDDPQFRAMGFTSFDSIVRRTAGFHANDGTFNEMIDEDYPAFGKAYRDISDEEWTIVRSITMERHFALNWLCGYAPGHRWDETPTDT